MFKIIKIETSGMKGQEKDISFQFLNETINYSLYSKAPAIKAIYGTNGSGKSSFINAIDVYKNICEQDSYMVTGSEIKSLSKLINKKTKKFSISVWVSNCECKVTYCHKIVVNNQTQKPYIEEESISLVKGRTINDEVKTILRIESGNMIEFSNAEYYKDVDAYLIKSINKLSQYRGVISLFSDINFYKDVKSILPHNQKEPVVSYNSLFGSLLNIHLFVRSLSVYMNEPDKHFEIDESSYEFIKENFNRSLNENPIILKSKLVYKKNFEAYVKQVSRVAEFIKLYKPSLENIEIEKREDGDIYHCKLIMKYDGYSIDAEYESAGIRNLMDMFSYLENASRGGIAFIDEMDVNMSEVYLTKLCEYFANYSKGQLCFTTHNTAPMKILKSVKRGIDFINGFSECVPWKKHGNSNPANLYTDGMVVGIPYNIEDFNFADVFKD